jgi:hypothetical protein
LRPRTASSTPSSSEAAAPGSETSRRARAARARPPTGSSTTPGTARVEHRRRDLSFKFFNDGAEVTQRRSRKDGRADVDLYGARPRDDPHYQVPPAPVVIVRRSRDRRQPHRLSVISGLAAPKGQAMMHPGSAPCSLKWPSRCEIRPPA